MKTIGRHLIVEFYCCNPAVLNDRDRIREHMLTAARTIGATVLGDFFHQFSPQGVSGTVVIAESHLSIHTWPESGYVAIDIYTCGGLNPRVGFDYLGRALEAESSRTQEILRGLPDEVDTQGTLLPDDVQVVTRIGEAHRLRDPEPALATAGTTASPPDD